MDPSAPGRNLFSRGASPLPGQSPLQHQLQHSPQQQQQPPPPQAPATTTATTATTATTSTMQPTYQHISPTQSLREVPVSSPTRVDQLFQSITPPGSGQLHQHAHPHAVQQSVSPQHQQQGPGNNSGAGTPVSVAASSSSAPSNQPSASRESALLSLLGSVSPPSNNSILASQQQQQHQQQPQQQQTPTPPTALPANSENQGRLLLEQIMHGATRPNYPPVVPPAVSGLAAHYPPSPYPPTSYRDAPLQDAHETGSYYEPESVTIQDLQQSPHIAPPPPPPPPVSEAQQQQQQQQQMTSSSPPKSLFDFVSPFDMLSSPGTSAASGAGRKPIPPVADAQAWPAIDPKRASVDNLIEQLTRAHPPPPPVQPAQQPMYEMHSAPPPPPPPPADELEHGQAKQARPLPPKPPMHVAGSPRASPPKAPATQQMHGSQPGGGRGVGVGRQQAESPLGPLVAPPLAQNQNPPRDKDESPGPRTGGWKAAPQDVRGRGAGGKGKGQNQGGSGSAPPPPPPPAQSIVFDVSQPLEEIRAPDESVKSTAIALVRVDATFLPGTTIGATHWVAYAMTKGRVRVISRSTGDRTLLQLPTVFPPTSAVCDMAVYSNRLAGVTSDGGFVLWELPSVITDDVPGRIILCILPTHGPEGLHSVKWHPKDENTLAVASESSVFVINVSEADRIFGSETISQAELARICRPMHMPSPLVAFEFDVVHSAIATIYDDSTLTLHGLVDYAPFWQAKVKGEGAPSSITFVDGGLVVGRRAGTVYQLLAHLSAAVHAEIRFVNGDNVNERDDGTVEMFGHANYDARIQTLWIANSRRNSMLAFRLGFDAPSSPGRNGNGNGNGGPRGYFEQVVEFVGPRPTIHFVILTADADPTGEEALAACVAAKEPPGELALVAFSVHSTGVDQVLIRREWFARAHAMSTAKLPSPLPPQQQQQQQQQPSKLLPSQAPPPPPQQQQPVQENRAPRQGQQQSAPVPLAQPVAHPSPVGPPRLRTPTSEEVEPDLAHDIGSRPAAEGRARGGKSGKNVGWKKGEDGNSKASGAGSGNASGGEPADTIGKELKKMEESLHLRITRHINKELEKQHQRLEEVRVHEQAADFARQEKILKLISNELTKNTTRVVEMAVKSEVQNSVLPSLEVIMKNEVKLALSGQIAKGLGDTMNKALPSEIERLLLRPDVSAHVARTFSSAITPVIERHVKEAIHQTLIPTYQQQSSAMHQELAREMQAEMLNIKKEVIAWQTDALRGQEATIRDLEQSVRAMSDQLKFLSMNIGMSARRSSTPPSGPVVPYNPQQVQAQAHLRQGPPPPPQQQQQQQQQQQHQQQQHITYGPLPPAQQLVPPPLPPQATLQGGWFQPTIPAPQASHPAVLPAHHSPPAQAQAPSEEWDDTYLAVLGTQDSRQLRELLARSNPDVTMPLKGQPPLSQAVILTLVHRLSAAIGETSPVDESFKSTLWWLQRASAVLNTTDPIISPYVARVLPSVIGMLNTTKQRNSIIPNAPQALDTARSIQDIQDILSRKPT